MFVLAEEGADLVVEPVGGFEVDEMAHAGKDDQSGSRYTGMKLPRHREGRTLVSLA